MTLAVRALVAAKLPYFYVIAELAEGYCNFCNNAYSICVNVMTTASFSNINYNFELGIPAYVNL